MAGVMIVEPDKIGSQHAVINRAMIEVFSRLFHGMNMIFLCAESHYNEVLNVGAWRRIYVSKSYGIKRHVGSFVAIFQLIFVVMRLKPKIIVFLSLSPLQYLLVRLASYFFMSKQVFVVCHGELSLVEKTPSLASKLIKASFLFSNRKIRERWTYILLNKKMVIPSYMPDRVVKLNHPALFVEPSRCESHRPKDKKLNIGLIGVASESKGSRRFFEMAERLKDEGRFNFMVTGMVDASLSNFKGGVVEADYSGNFLSQEEVHRKLLSLDLAVFVYDEAYADVPSGSLIDAINYSIPSLVIRNSYFDYLIDNGISVFKVFESFEELESYIRKVDIQAAVHLAGFDRARSFFSIDQAVKDLEANCRC